ncbi:MAG: hypothetical protein OEW68_14800 [Gammaproteobacteria bacterium]|nr:hypothetical protein [Gammaproteobacteria bacterium]
MGPAQGRFTDGGARVGGNLIVVLIAIVTLSTVACEFNRWRLARSGEPVPLVDARVSSPGPPWYRGPYGAAAPVLGSTSWVSNLTTGTYSEIAIAYNRVLTANVGPIGPDPTDSTRPTGNEAIFAYSKLWRQPIPGDYLEAAISAAWKDLVHLYKIRGLEVVDIEDITSRYHDSLAFWPNYMFALAYSAGGERYELVHAFTVVAGAEPGTTVVHDFSYIIMERAGEQDHFDDFIAMLKSLKTD